MRARQKIDRLTMSYYPPSTVIPIYSVFMGVAVALTALRLWVRLSFARIALGADDYLLLTGLAIAITCNGIQYYNALKGTGGEAIKDPNERTQMVIISHQIDWASESFPESFIHGRVRNGRS